MSIEALIERMSRALQGLSELPWGVHALVALAMAAGLVLWLTGERWLKPLVLIIAAFVGATLGFLFVSVTPWGQSGSITVYHGMLGGLFVGLLAGILMFRSAIALGSGVVFGLMLPMTAAGVLGLMGNGSSVALEWHGPPAHVSGTGDTPHIQLASDTTQLETNLTEMAELSDALPAVIARARKALASGGQSNWPLAQLSPGTPNLPTKENVVEAGKAAEAAIADKIPDKMKPAAARVHTFLTEAFARADEEWAAMPGMHRAIITLCAAIGLAGGVILGLSMPRWAAGAVTSLFGAAVWLACFVWMSNAVATPWRTTLDRPALQWLAIWLGVGLLGMLVQWSGVLGKIAKKQESAAPKAAVA